MTRFTMIAAALLLAACAKQGDPGADAKVPRQSVTTELPAPKAANTNQGQSTSSASVGSVVQNAGGFGNRQSVNIAVPAGGSASVGSISSNSSGGANTQSVNFVGQQGDGQIKVGSVVSSHSGVGTTHNMNVTVPAGKTLKADVIVQNSSGIGTTSNMNVGGIPAQPAK